MENFKTSNQYVPLTPHFVKKNTHTNNHCRFSFPA